jgi:hypothetical protein
LITLRDTPQSVGLHWTRDRLDAEASTWQQHTTLTRDKHPCPPVGFKPTILASERPKTHALDRTATGHNKSISYKSIFFCPYTLVWCKYKAVFGSTFSVGSFHFIEPWQQALLQRHINASRPLWPSTLDTHLASLILLTIIVPSLAIRSFA